MPSQSLYVALSSDILDKRLNPHHFAEVERRMADAARALHTNEGYRHFGLYCASLVQGIDLFELSEGPLASGKSGEVCQRVGSVIKQALRARDARQSAEWSFSTKLVVALIALLLIICTAVLGVLVYWWINRDRAKQ